MTNSIKYLNQKASIDLLKEVPVSMKSRFLRPFLKANTERTRLFFSKYRRSPAEAAITDFSTGHFSSFLLEELRAIPDVPFDLCVDLGCGQSNLRTSCTPPLWKQYVGADLLIDEQLPVGSVDILVEHNLNIGLPELPESSNTIFVAVNLLCYLEDISPLMSNIASRPGRRTVLFLEPQPSILWECAFYGFRLFYRTPEEILHHLGTKAKSTARTKINLGLPGLKHWTASNLLRIELA